MRVLGRQIYRFDGVEVDPSQGCLRRDGSELKVRQKSLRMLLYLIEQRERLVTKEELIGHVWEGLAVTDDALVQLVKEVRRHLGDDSKSPRYIKTVPRVGYRFTAPVEEVFVEPPSVEIERHATVEIEFEEEITDASETDAIGGAASERRQVAARTARVFSRTGIALAVAIAILSLGALAAYFANSQRTRPTQAATPTLPTVPGKRTLAVMHFENLSGSADLDWLREGLADMLVTGLSRSTKLSVLGRQQLRLLLERVGHDPEGNVSFDEALGVAHKAQAEVVVLGSFARLDGKIRVDVQVYDAREGRLLTSEDLVVEQPAQLLTQINLLSLKLASDLNAPADEGADAGLAGVMTNNLQAYRYYSLGVEKANALDYVEAVALLEQAVRLDPEFAMAYARIGYTYALCWVRPEEGKPYLEKAFRLSDRLTAKDRLSINAWYAVAQHDYPAAIEAYRQIIARYPLEVEAYWRLSRLLRGEDRMEESVEAAKQGLAVDSEAKDLYNVLGGTLMEMGRHDEAIAASQRYVELASADPNSYDTLGMSYQWAGRYAEAARAYEKALSLDPRFEIALIHLGNVYVWQGRYQEAMQQYQRLIQVASSDDMRGRAYSSIAQLHLKRGELGQAERAAKAANQFNKLYVEPLLRLALERGDLAMAEKLMTVTEAAPYLDRGNRGFERSRYYYRGYLALKSGRADESVEHFKEALRHRPMTWNIDALEDCLANAYLELGQLDEAVAEYERVLRLNPNYPLAEYHLAQALERKGQVAEALTAYGRFLQTWEGADADLPEVLAARNLLTKGTRASAQ